ncbi:hypothetical protein [Mesoterricola sediminis]|uniref:hypothetical protein n=1 Tax=Mesoterricola sediminis TaxID=2927980 RepID=UPI00292D5C00|nr:hypothetical protein [Mesoterricola sediminis]
MSIDWDLFSRYLGPIAGVSVGAFLNRHLEKRPKVISYLAHSSAVKMPIPDGESLVVHTHSIVVRNAGRKTATNIRLGHTALPAFSVFPPCQYEVIDLPDKSGNEICIPKLRPDEQVTLAYLYFPPLLWSGINTYAKSDEGFVEIINVLPTPQPARWLKWLSSVLVVLGATTAIYMATKIMTYIYRLASA